MNQEKSLAYSISLILGIWLLAPTSTIRAQGCSDAGFCTIGTHKAQKSYENRADLSRHRFTIMSPVGQGDDAVFVWTPALQYEYYTSGGWDLQARFTGNYASGSLGSFLGVGDLYLAATRNRELESGWRFSWTAGVKIPLDMADASEAGMPLPMQYQSSLGTFDLIAGLGFSNQHWQFNAGYQQPLSGTNQNGFLPQYWNGKPEADNYPSSFMLDRKGDFLLRASRQIVANKKFYLNAGVLGIYHLGEDSYTNPFENNKEIAIVGSDGVTLNLTGSGYWQINNRTRLGLQFGVPLVVRDVRPDGLTRQWVLAPEISWNF